MYRCWLALALVAGCIEPPTFQVCGDAACPSDTICYAELAPDQDPGRRGLCVPTAAVTACSELAAGEVCSVAGPVAFDGVCADGFCQLPRCGDGVAEGSEPCEGEDLRGKTCEDLGRYPLTDAALTCTPLCTFDLATCGGFCGDGERHTQREVCEGDDVQDFTCRDFAFYRGEIACNHFCQLDTSGCAGRCGDGAIDVGEGEQCDAPGPVGNCVTFGFDIGTLQCDACRRSFATCSDFGWEQIASDIDNTAGPFWATRTLTVLPMFDSVSIIDLGLISTYPELAGAAVTAKDDYAVVATETLVKRYNLGGVWTDLPLPAGGFGGAPKAIDIDSQDRIYVLANPCTVWLYDGNWSQLATNPPSFCTVLAVYAPDNLWVSGSHWNGASWAGVITGVSFLYDLEIEGPTSVLAATTDGLIRGTRTGIEVESFGVYSSVEIIGDIRCASTNGRLECVANGNLRLVPPPTGTTGIGPAQSRDDQLTSLSDGGIYKLDTAAVETFEPPSATRVVDIAVSRFNDNVIALREDVIETDAGTLVRRTLPFEDGRITVPYGSRWLLVDAFGEIYEIWPSTPSTYHGNCTDGAVPLDGWSLGAGDVWVTTNAGTLWHSRLVSGEPTTCDVEPLPLPTGMVSCVATQLDGRANNDIFALAACSTSSGNTHATVYHYNGTTWSVWYGGTASSPPPFDGMLVPAGDDRVVLTRSTASPREVIWLRAGTQVAMQSIDVGPHLTGSAADDIFAYGTLDALNLPRMFHWDGQAWSLVRVPGDYGKRIVATRHMLYGVGPQGTWRLMRL